MRNPLSHSNQHTQSASPRWVAYTRVHTLTRRYGRAERSSLNMDKRTRDLKSDYLLADKIQTKEVQTAASLWEGPTR